MIVIRKLSNLWLLRSVRQTAVVDSLRNLESAWTLQVDDVRVAANPLRSTLLRWKPPQVSFC